MSRKILGHFAMRLYRGWRVHLFEVKDGGAGSVLISAVCGGTDPWVRVDSSTTARQWETWKAAQAPIKGWPEWSTIKRVDCPRCEPIYTKRRGKHTQTPTPVVTGGAGAANGAGVAPVDAETKQGLQKGAQQ